MWWTLRTPGQHRPVMVRQGKGRGQMGIPPPGAEMGQQAKKLGEKEKCMDSRSLAIISNYHLPRKNASFRFVILHGHLWGGRFQMPVIGERQVTGGNGRDSQTEKSRYGLSLKKILLQKLWYDASHAKGCSR